MNSNSVPMQRNSAGFVILLYTFALFSGVAALIYEVSWGKTLALTFGRSTLAVTAVVGGFMLGMGIGAWLYHKAQAGRFNAVKLYAILEIGIAAVTALLTPALGLLPEFFAAAAGFVPAGLVMDLFRTILVVVILLPPAALMGATFPALCTVLIQERDGVARHLGPIYGLNTVGAALGAMIAGFVLMELVGLQGSVRIANGINLTIGLLAWFLSTRTAGASLQTTGELDDTEAVLSTALPVRVTAVVLFVSGLATLAYEIVWFRALRYLFGVSTYAFTVMLVIFLVGLGVGGLLTGRIRARDAPEKLLAFSQFGIAGFAIAAIGAEYLVLTSPEILAHVSIFSPEISGLMWQWRVLLAVLVALAMMLPATLLMGFSFPIASRLFLGDVRRLGERIGTAYLLANLGSIIGVGAAAFFILPYFGTIRGTLFIAFVNILLGIVVLASLPARGKRKIAWATVPAVMLILMLMTLPGHLPFPFVNKGMPEMIRLWSEEGDVATVQVWALKDRPFRRGLFVDGTSIGETNGLRQSIWGKQRILAHLPMALAPETRTTLNVGFGSGSTVDALASYPAVEQLDVVEISASVVRGSKGYFMESNVLGDPRVRLEIEDIAHYLLRDDSLYDLIISDGKLAESFSGNELMLCRDFYEQAKRRLSEFGIFIQWLPPSYPSAVFKIILRTFLASFPEAELFFDSSTGLYFVGSRHPIGTNRIARLDSEIARGDLAQLDIPNMEALMARWLAGGQALRRIVGEGRISTWDHSVTEFAISRANAESLSADRAPNLALFLDAGDSGARNPFLPADSPFIRSVDLVNRSLLAEFREDYDAAIRLANDAAQLNPADPTPKTMLRRLNRLAAKSP